MYKSQIISSFENLEVKKKTIKVIFQNPLKYTVNIAVKVLKGYLCKGLLPGTKKLKHSLKLLLGIYYS